MVVLPMRAGAPGRRWFLAVVCLLIVIGLAGCGRRADPATFLNEPLPAGRTYADAAASLHFSVHGTVTLADEATAGRRQTNFSLTIANRTQQPIRGLRVRAELPEAVRAYRDPGFTHPRAFGSAEPLDLILGQVPLGLAIGCAEPLPEPAAMTQAEREELYAALREPIRLHLQWEGGEEFLELAPEQLTWEGFPEWPTPAALAYAMKGYELYSRQEGGEWLFTLITGTNRNKTCKEITSGVDETDGGWVNLTAHGVPAVKELLARLPAGESVFWLGSAGLAADDPCPLAMPGEAVVAEVREACERAGLELTITAQGGA